ncbi:MAG: hypothetical protein AB7G13_11550 [Lautropia sp.]
MPHYHIRDTETGSLRLIRARTPAAARRYALDTRLAVETLTSEQVIDMLQRDRDLTVESAGDDGPVTSDADAPSGLPAGTPTAADLELDEKAA